ncbi:DUF1800 family protein [Hyunsoonleella sp. SJ7]|uniref:DUF1800 family protein n=1 Tax=Hyunsoonleella aquatilis TaxID=2762758 RepID=A0A923KIW6_9FLAO|nr:DUF1800 family protein [Hyunsoonleella aquatilis]MBC3759309.1 DUF1800 family protein [Hyunsoonleella aquatilis]
MASLNPLSGTLGLRRAKHLLRRTTFNYTKLQIEAFANMTATNAVNSLSSNPINKIAEPYDPLPNGNPDGFWLQSTEHPNTFGGQSRKRSHITAWWWYNALNEVSLKHKLSFFLHTCFTVGKDSGVGHSPFFYDHIRLLDFYALGNIKTLAKKITLDNGMLDYLDNTQNNKNNPNENYAREYLELFTILKGEQIGEGNYTNYTELDIQQAAKVFSGFKKKYDRNGDIDPDTGIPIGYLALGQHDTNDKTFSSAFGGQTITGRNTASGMMDELDDFVEMVFAQPETAKAYCRKLYRYFVKSTWDDTVETDIITPLAQQLIDNNFEILPVVTTLLSSEHFYDADDGDATDNIIGSIIKSPLQLLTEVCSMFEPTIPDPAMDAFRFYVNFYLRFIHNTYYSAAGMEIYNPDSVAGYPAYYQEPSFDRIWFSSNTLIGRYKLIESLIIGRNTIDNNANIYATLDTVVFVETKITNASDPNLLVIEIADLLYPESIDEDRKDYFKSFLVEGFNDYYWTGAWLQYINTHSEADKTTVKTRLDALITAMVNAAEFQLM